MSKSDCMWVGIRLLGLFLVAKAVLVLPEVPAKYMAKESVRELAQVVDESKEAHKIFKEMGDVLACGWVESAIKFVLYSLAGLYFCRWGKIFHRFIMPPEEVVDVGSGGFED